MPKINNINNFIIPAQDNIYYDLYYTEIIGGTAGCVANVNGVSVNVAPQSNIFITVNSFSGGTGCFLGGYQPDKLTKSFVSVWDTTKISTGSSTATQIKLPLNSAGSYNFIVEWGDGSSDKITTWNQAQTTHTYSTAGVYQITITGTIRGFGFVNAGDRLKLLSIFRWGTGFRLGDVNGQFYGCANLGLSEVEDVLNLEGTTNFAGFFRGCDRLGVVNRMNEWDTSKVTYFTTAFYLANNFNTYIGDWDTSNVTNMSFMFGLVSPGKFNQDISRWNTSKVTTMAQMFQGQIQFNQDLSTKVVTVRGSSYIAWDTSNVNDMSFMFGGAGGGPGIFNQNIGNWNTSKVTLMSSMFFNKTSFNQDISTKVVTVSGSSYVAWDTSNVTNMGSMFNCSSGFYGVFNQNIGNWNTSKVTTMNSMFARQSFFNQDISTKVVTLSGSSYIAWNTSNVTNIGGMFGCYTIDGNFNQNIGNWDTNKVTNMAEVFTAQPYFNQNVGTKLVTVSGMTYSAWTVSAVTSMNYMFYHYNPITTGRLAGSFNNSGSTSINNWDTRKVTLMQDMFNNQTGFNQPISNWNISGVTIFNATGATDGFMFGKTSNDYSTTNYDALLIGWASRSVKPNLKIDFGTIKYTSAATAARAVLTSAPNNWTIIDGGLA